MAKKVRKLFGERPERVHVLSEAAEFDAEGIADVSDEAFEVFINCPGYEAVIVEVVGDGSEGGANEGNPNGEGSEGEAQTEGEGEDETQTEGEGEGETNKGSEEEEIVVNTPPMKKAVPSRKAAPSKGRK